MVSADGAVMSDNDIEHDPYADGYDDGLADALVTVERCDSIAEAIRAIKRMQGYVDCLDCGSTGERSKITQADLCKALLSDLGAVVGSKPTVPDLLGRGSRSPRDGGAVMRWRWDKIDRQLDSLEGWLSIIVACVAAIIVLVLC